MGLSAASAGRSSRTRAGMSLDRTAVLFCIATNSWSVIEASGLTAPGAGRGRGRRGGARALEQRLERPLGAGARARILHEARGVRIAEHDRLQLVGELLAVQIRCELALLDG